MRFFATILVLLLAAGPLKAAVVSGIYAVRATGFQPAGPPDPTDLTFAIAFQNTADITDATTSVALLASFLPLGSVIAFSYEVNGDNLILGGLQNGADSAAPGTNDFVLTIGGISTNPIFASLLVTRSDDSRQFFLAGAGTIRKEAGAVPVSAPGSLALVVAALAGLTLARRRAVPAAAALLALLLAASPLRAAPFAALFDVTFSGVQPPLSPDPGGLAFDIAFDTSTSIFNEIKGINLRSQFAPLGSPISFTYQLVEDVLTVGGLNLGAVGAAPGTFDFILTIRDLSTNPVFGSLIITTPGNPDGFFVAARGFALVEMGAVRVGAPGAVALLGMALAGFVVLRRHPG